MPDARKHSYTLQPSQNITCYDRPAQQAHMKEARRYATKHNVIFTSVNRATSFFHWDIDAPQAFQKLTPLDITGC